MLHLALVNNSFHMEQPAVTHEYTTAILTGDTKQLQQLYRQLFPMIRDMVWKYGGSEQDARDVFQDAVMVVFHKAKQPGFLLTSQFSTFFYGIALNVWRSRRKKKSNSEVMIPEDAQYIADDLSEFDHLKLERQSLFDKAFAQLGEDCQRLLLLFFQKKSMDEIAAEMGFGSDNYAARRKHTCKERLVDMIKSYPEFRELRNH